MTEPKRPALVEVGEGTSTLVLEGAFGGLTKEALFEHWVRPERLTRWWPAEASVEPVPGGAYRLSWPAMGWTLDGRVVEIDPPRRLCFTWRWPHEPDLPERRVTLTFADGEGEGARLRIEHGDYGATDVEQTDRQSHLDGWLHFCGQLRALGS